MQEKIKRIVSFFHHSVKASDKLCEIQDQNNMQKKKLIMDVETRWNSTFFMMNRFLEQRENITTTLCLLGKTVMCLDGDELEVVRNAVGLLEPYEEATREMSAEKFTSLSKVIPVARALQECNSNMPASPLGTELKRQLQRRFPAVEQMFSLAAATLLDNRFKKMPFADVGNIKSIEDRLCSLMRSKYSTESVPPAAGLPSENDSKEMQVGKGSLWRTFDEKVHQDMKTKQSTASGPHIELRRYLEEALIPRGADPLQWWEKHSSLFPKLQRLAKKYLSIPATSVPAERLFSKAGELVSHRRSALSDENINMILFLYKNLE